MGRCGSALMKLVVFAMAMMLIGCGGGGGGGGDGDGPSAEGDNRFYTNPGDGRLFQLQESDGSSLTYMGAMDDQGNLTRLSSVVVEDPDLAGDLVYVLDDEGRPASIHTPEVTFELGPTSDTSLQLTAFFETDKLQVSIPVELETGISTADAGNLSGSGYTYRAVAASDASMRVSVTRCGDPVENALLSLSISPPMGAIDPIGTHVGEGYYDFYLPKTLDPRLDNYKQCDQIGRKVREYCPQVALIAAFKPESCEALEQAVDNLASLPFSVIDNPEEIKRKIRSYCRPALLEHLPKLYDQVCKDTELVEWVETMCRMEAVTEEPADSHNFSVSVQIPGEEAFTSSSAAFFPNDPSEWALEMPNEVSMGGNGQIYTDPTQPLNTEWYTAHATLACTDPDDGSVVTMKGSTISGEPWNGETQKTMYDVDTDIHLDVPPVSDASMGTVEVFTVEADGRLIKNKVIVRAGQGSADPTEAQYHIFRRSGSGYAKRYGGYANYHTGHDVFYKYGLASEINAFIAAASRFEEWTEASCAAGPSPYTPTPPWPDIWISGNVEYVTSVSTSEQLDTYTCENRFSANASILCNEWTIESSTEFWDEIDGVCGGG